MQKNPILILLLLLSCYWLKAQDMQAGFELLESQQFKEAEQYFGQVLDTYPESKTAQICYYRSIGLAGNHIDALAGFIKMEKSFDKDYEVGLNVAEALMWNQEFIRANKKYENLSLSDPKNFVARLGLANSLSSLGKNIEALDYINQCLELKKNDPVALNSKKYILIALAYTQAKKRNHTESLRWLDSIALIEENQPNALVIRKLIEDQKANSSKASYTQSSDMAGNQAQDFSFVQSINFHPKHRLELQYLQRNTSNHSAKAASQRTLGIQDNFYARENITVSFGVVLNTLSSESQTKSNLAGKLKTSWQMNSYNYFSGGYSSRFLNYNTTLLNSQLRVDRYELQHHAFVKNIGWYNAIARENITDGNNNLQWFSSLYYQLLNKPILKTGINYSHTAYQTNRAELYFSPGQYQALEAFVHLENLGISESRVQYKIALSQGLQKFEQNEAQNTTRVDLSLGYRHSKKILINLDYLYSSSAQTTTVGSYQFNRIGLSAKLIL